MERRQQAIAELTEYFTALLELRAKRPQDDLISLLLMAEIDSESG